MNKSETISREENIRCRLCICEAVEYFREGLKPFVELRLQTAYWPNWIPKVNAIIDEKNKKKGPNDPRISRLRVDGKGKKIHWDSRSLLKAIDLTFDTAFQGEFQCTQYQVKSLLDRLNDFSHEKKFRPKEAKLTRNGMEYKPKPMLQGMEYILKAVNALNEAKLVNGVLRRLVDESSATSRQSDETESPMEAGENMSKLEAVRLAVQCGVSLADTRFANINQSRPDLWWLDIPVKKIRHEEDITLLLYDCRMHKLHCLQVPTVYFRENRVGLDERMVSGVPKIGLYLSTDKGDLFRDKRGKGKIPFAQFKHGEC